MAENVFWEKIESLVERYNELSALMNEPEIISDQEKFRNFAKEHHQLQPLVEYYEKLKEVDVDIESSKALLEEDDKEIVELAREEILENKKLKEKLIKEIQFLLIPKDPDDKRNIFLEIRAGTGGDEAGIFVGDLFRMYSRYAESRNWNVEIISC